jgi:SAM-dependent methyltransferase
MRQTAPMTDDQTLDDRKAGLGRVFDAASDQYEAGPAQSWGRIGEALVQAAAPLAGERVLDVASGAGTTALPAAEAVGPHGSVVAVDLSARLLELASRAARDRGLDNLLTRVGDFENTGYADESFDVVLCSLGIFFTADIPLALRELWRMVAPDGRLGISTWAGAGLNDVFEPFGEAVREVWPEMPTDDSLPWNSIGDGGGLVAAFTAAGTETPVVSPLRFSEPIEPGRMWASFMGSGLRGLLDRFTSVQQARIRDGLARRLAERGIDSFNYDLLLAVATKPGLGGTRESG